jgi:probable HAF family extracellular repeat protein
MKSTRTLIGAVAALLLSTAASVAAPVYKIEVIPGKSGYVPRCAMAINNAGAVVGTAYLKVDSTRSTVFRYVGGAVSLMPAGEGSGVWDINEAGDTVGFGADSVLWRADGSVAAVSPYTMMGLNDHGVFVGTDYDPQNFLPRALMVKEGVLSDLGTLGGSTASAVAVNNVGQVAGSAALAGDLVSHAFIWKDGAMQDIGTQRPGSSYATGINDKGHVAGYFFNENGQDGFLYDGATMRALPRLQTKPFTPNALNAKDEVVGSDGARAALYTKGKLYVLKNLLDASGTGWKALDTAASINDKGQIAGCGTYQGVKRAYVATRVVR